MSPDNSVQNFLPSHIWLICSRRRAQDSCLIIPVMTECAASFERSPGREYHQKMTLKVWHNERRPSEGGGTCNEMKQLSTNLQIFSGRSDILCFIQVMLPVSALDNCIIRAASPLLRGRGRTGDGAWRDIVRDDSLLGGGETRSCRDISDSSRSLSLHVGFQPDLRSSRVSGWALMAKGHSQSNAVKPFSVEPRVPDSERVDAK